MSLVNFKVVSEAAPDLRSTAEALEEWLSSHPEVTTFTTDLLSEGLAHRVSINNLLRLIAQLKASDQLDAKLRVQFSDGSLSEDEFDSIEELESHDCVFNTFFEPVPVTAGRAVAVYRILH